MGGGDEHWKEEAGPNEHAGPDRVMMPEVVMPEVVMPGGAVNESWTVLE